ncbi:MAG: hypothetical protein JNM70_21885 [Anaerolineae bacterium]|nr:hypothetical protein [Anaerolineae bacterium]
MVDHFQLGNYEIQSRDENTTLLLIKGHRKYYSILCDAFPEYRFSIQFADVRKRFDWGTYIYGLMEKEPLTKLIDMMKKVVCIDIENALEMTFALGYHTDRGKGKTTMGEVVYKAKPYHNSPTSSSIRHANILAEWYCSFMRRHPAYARADYVLSVPARAGKSFDLPNHIVEVICRELGIANGAGLVYRARETRPMKDLKTQWAKTENMRDAFAVNTGVSLVGKSVVVIDDICQSGITLHQMAVPLQSTGATVFGLVATKTLSDPQ